MRILENYERGIRVKQVEQNHGHTYAWLFSDVVPFQDWLRGVVPLQQESIFWIQGKPGSGKSTLMKYALLNRKTRELLQESNQGPWSLIPFFFSDRGSPIQKTVEGLLQELLHRILSHYTELIELVISISLRITLSDFSKRRFIFEDHDLGRVVWSRKSIQDARKFIADNTEHGGARTMCTSEVIKKALVAITRQSEVQMNILFFIDALDEHQGSHRDLVEILKSLSNPESSATVRIKLCLASRYESVFPGAFHDSPGFAIQDYTHSDIKQYVIDHLQRTFDISNFSEVDRKQIKPLTVDIVERAKGIFIWVKLVVDELIEGIIDGNSISQLRQILASIPTGLDALYNRIIQKRKPEHLIETYIMAQVLLCSLDPVSLQSLMAITDVALSDDAVEKMSLPRMRQRLASRCGGLIDIYEETTNQYNVGDKKHDGQKNIQEHAEDDENGNSCDKTNSKETGSNSYEQSLSEDGSEDSSDDNNSREHQFGISVPEQQHMNDLINNELFGSDDESGKVYRVQFLHQTVKTFLESPRNTKAMSRDPEQCPSENGWSYILRFCVKAMTQMEFNQALVHRSIIKRLFSYAKLLEQHTKTDSADLLGNLLIEHRNWFPENFEYSVCAEKRAPGERKRIWDHCVHFIPHNRLRTDGLNLWQICAHDDQRSSRGFLLLRCRALPIHPSTRTFDLVLLAAYYGLSYYVQRKVLEGTSLICSKSNHSLLWATVDHCLRSRSVASFTEELELLDFIIQRSPNVDLVYSRRTPLALTIDSTVRYLDPAKGINPLILVRKLLCAGADAGTIIEDCEDCEALGWVISSFGGSPQHQRGSEIAKLLLHHGANPRIAAQNSLKPLYYSILWGNEMCTETLLRYGADPSNVGTNISALEQSTGSVWVPPGLTKWQHQEFQKFQRHAVQMHDLLVKYKNPACPPPLCQCMQKRDNKDNKELATYLDHLSVEGPAANLADGEACSYLNSLFSESPLE